MNNWYGDDVDEKTLIEENISQDDISDSNETYTLSLKVLKDILIKYGYTAKAYEMDYETLVKSSKKYAPILVHYNTAEGHFLLVLQADKDKVIVSDPANGTSVLFRSEFEKLFSKKVLLIHGSTLNEKKLKSTIFECEDRINFLQNSQVH